VLSPLAALEGQEESEVPSEASHETEGTSPQVLTSDSCGVLRFRSLKLVAGASTALHATTFSCRTCHRIGHVTVSVLVFAILVFAILVFAILVFAILVFAILVFVILVFVILVFAILSFFLWSLAGFALVVFEETFVVGA